MDNQSGSDDSESSLLEHLTTLADLLHSSSTSSSSTVPISNTTSHFGDSDLRSYVESIASSSTSVQHSGQVFKGRIVSSKFGKNPALLYLLPTDETQCYSFSLKRRNAQNNTYRCTGCKTDKKDILIKAAGDLFLEDPCTLDHNCKPYDTARQLANRLVFSELSTLRSKTKTGLTPKAAWSETLRKIEESETLSEEMKQQVKEAFYSHGSESRRKSYSRAINARNGKSQASTELSFPILEGPPITPFMEFDVQEPQYPFVTPTFHPLQELTFSCSDMKTEEFIPKMEVSETLFEPLSEEQGEEVFADSGLEYEQKFDNTTINDVKKENIEDPLDTLVASLKQLNPETLKELKRRLEL